MLQTGLVVLRARQCRPALDDTSKFGLRVPLHTGVDFLQIKPQCGLHTVAGISPLRRPPNGIRAHANEGREFFDR
jgi:hypothetical protein